MRARPGRATPDRSRARPTDRRYLAAELAVGSIRKGRHGSVESSLLYSLRPRLAGPGLIEESESYTGAMDVSIPNSPRLWKSRMVLVLNRLYFDTKSQIGAAKSNKLKDLTRSPSRSKRQSGLVRQTFLERGRWTSIQGFALVRLRFFSLFRLLPVLCGNGAITSFPAGCSSSKGSTARANRRS